MAESAKATISDDVNELKQRIAELEIDNQFLNELISESGRLVTGAINDLLAAITLLQDAD